MYLGDLVEDATIDFKFTTRDFDTGAPQTLGGTPALSVYKANGAVQSTAGITLTADFDSITGLNHVRIDTSADAFYATGNDYQVVITTGTVDTVSVVGEVVGTFSIENRSVNVARWAGTDVTLSPTTSLPEVDAKSISDNAAAADNVQSNIGNLDAAISGLNDLSAAQVNSEVVDVLRTDTNSELSQGAPPATPTFEEAIMLLYMAMRNKLDVDASFKEVHNDAGTVICKKALSDDGTTYSEAEMTTGP